MTKTTATTTRVVPFEELATLKAGTVVIVTRFSGCRRALVLTEDVQSEPGISGVFLWGTKIRIDLARQGFRGGSQRRTQYVLPQNTVWVVEPR